jgi:hypothetical protein
MQDLIFFNPTTGQVDVNLLDETTGTPQENAKNKRFNRALVSVQRQAQTTKAPGYSPNYLGVKEIIQNDPEFSKLAKGKRKELLDSFDTFYKKEVVQKFNTGLVPGYAPATATQTEGVGKDFFDPIFYLASNPEIKKRYDEAVEKGDLDIIGRVDNLNDFAGLNYVEVGIKNGKKPNSFGLLGNFSGQDPTGFKDVDGQAQIDAAKLGSDDRVQDAIITAAGENFLEQTEQFGLLAQDVLKETIEKLERAQQQQNQLDLFNNIGGFGEILNIGSNTANSLLGDLGGPVPPGVRDQIEGVFNSALGPFGNSTIVNWQNFFEQELTEKYAQEYNDKFAALELEKDIFENAVPDADSFRAYLKSRPEVEKLYEERIAGLTPADEDFISEAEFAKEFYRENGNKPEFRSRLLEQQGEVFDQQTGQFKNEFLREIGFQTSNEFTNYLNQQDNGRDILRTLTGSAARGGRELDPFDRIQELDAEIKRLDDPDNPDFNFIGNLRDERGGIRAVDIDSQFARDFINDYLRPRFNASKSINEFINFINVEEQFQNPFQTQTTQDALNNLAVQRNQEFIEGLKPVDDTFDPRFFENPFADRPVEEQKAADASRYERKLEFQKDYFKSEYEKAKNGDPLYINALLTRGVAVEPSLTFDGSLVYAIDKGGFARTLFDITRGGNDIEGNPIELDGQRVNFTGFDNPADPDRVADFKNRELIPSLIEQVERDGTSVFGDFISPDEFAEGAVDDIGVGPNTAIGRQLVTAGAEDELDEIKNALAGVVGGAETIDLRDRIKELRDAGEEISQKTLGVDYIERETDKEGAIGAGTGIFGIFQQAGFQGNEREFYETFFPGQSKEEVNAEFGDFDLLSGLNTSSPQAALSSVGSFLDSPSLPAPPSPDSFLEFGNNSRLRRQAQESQNFLNEFSSDLGGGDILSSFGGGLGGFGGFGF